MPTHSDPTGAADFRRLQSGTGDCVGAALRRALVTAADAWLTGLMAPAGPGVALVAVGAYGRAEPTPGSDLDLVLLHDGRRDIAAEADAGHEALSRQLVSSARSRWRARSALRLPELHATVVERWDCFGEVAFLLEPNLKQGRGGLQDMDALSALSAAAMPVAPSRRVTSAHAVLLDARGALPVRSGRSDDRLLLQEQDGVALMLGYDDADALVRAVAEAARTVAHAWDVGWHVVAGALASRSLAAA